jgi:hypothetical protein
LSIARDSQRLLAVTSVPRLLKELFGIIDPYVSEPAGWTSLACLVLYGSTDLVKKFGRRTTDGRDNDPL